MAQVEQETHRSGRRLQFFKNQFGRRYVIGYDQRPNKPDNVLLIASVRELHVLALEQFGLTEKGVGFALKISPRTVKKFKTSLYARNLPLILRQHSPEWADQIRREIAAGKNPGRTDHHMSLMVTTAYTLGLLHPRSLKYLETVLDYPERIRLPQGLIASYCLKQGIGNEFRYTPQEWLTFCELVGCDPLSPELANPLTDEAEFLSYLKLAGSDSLIKPATG